MVDLAIERPAVACSGLPCALAFFAGGRYHYLTAGFVVILHAVVDWFGLGARSAGIRAGSITVVAGSIIGEIAHD